MTGSDMATTSFRLNSAAQFVVPGPDQLIGTRPIAAMPHKINRTDEVNAPPIYAAISANVLMTDRLWWLTGVNGTKRTPSDSMTQICFRGKSRLLSVSDYQADL